MTRQLSLGVIGHVDHGKTSLVKALTETDTDRLKEEKERGMSIVLGFAYLQCDEGCIDVIDVPGHESFIRTMVSGATGIDAALLVVDANEGVKPQTVEHLAITGLLGVRRGVVAITKSDLVRTEERIAVSRRLRGLLKESYLEFAPLVFTSTVTGEGLRELADALRSLLRNRSAPIAASQFWLPIDRAFSVAGRGTVVTGTMRLGCLKVGQEVEVMPQGTRATVRHIEVHGREVEEVQPGQRAGVNLRHIKHHEISRGGALASVGLLHTNDLLDAQVSLLKTQKSGLRNGRVVRLLFGTTDVAVHIRILSGSSLEPGQSGAVQFRTLRPVAAIAGEPFILRIESPAMTIGGGRFLDTAPVRHRRSNAAAITRLQILAGGAGDAVLIERLKSASAGGMPAAALAAQLRCSEKEVMNAVAHNDAIMVHEKCLLYRPFFDGMGDRLANVLEQFHRQFPMRQGAPLSYCRANLDPMNESLFKSMLRALCDAGRIQVERGLVSVFGYDPVAALGEEDRKLAVSIETSIKQGGRHAAEYGRVSGRRAALRRDFLHADRAWQPACLGRRTVGAQDRISSRCHRRC
jgi:selenocysteine-specific elongation factor